jgi:hypothetical protein
MLRFIPFVKIKIIFFLKAKKFTDFENVKLKTLTPSWVLKNMHEF